MGLLLIGSVVVAFLIPRKVPGIALMGLGVLYLSDSLVWLYQLAHGLTLSSAQERSIEESASLSGLPGGWIAMAAAIGLVLLGLFRFLSSYVRTEERTTS
jgi:hypothetical protein